MPAVTDRPMVLHLPSGDALFFQSMTGYEEVSRLFEYEVSALSSDPTLTAESWLGAALKVSVEVDGEGTKRWFHGIVCSFGIDGQVGRYFRYRLTLRPWLWLLTRSQNIRIFQDKTALEILTEVFGSYTSNVANETTTTYATRTYCVQYRETDFNFVSRLLEEEGINYFFRHSQNSLQLVLCDAPGAHVAATGCETVRYFENPEGVAEVSALHEWRMKHEIQPGKFVLKDYNFETPATDLTTTVATGTREHAQKDYEVYDYPGLYPVKADGDLLAQVRLGEADSRYARFTGQGNVPGLAAGFKFTLDNHPRPDQNTEYVVLQTRIELRLSGYESASNPQEAVLDTQVGCSIVAQPAAEPLRPQRITRKPHVQGPQTAVVVGDADAGDILTDEFGRVKVQFHWDRIGTKTAASSCWLRVASPSAGNGWGFFSLPRLGDEVVVDFLEGDPDQPLVTGRVHNAVQKVPYELPAAATISTWKSRSKLGAAAKFNEIRYDDTDGSEYLLIHAQKDRLEFVEEVFKSKIDKSEHRSVVEDRKEKIDKTHHFHVVQDAKYKYDAKYHLKVVGNMLYKTDALFSLNAKEDIVAKSGAAITLHSGKDMHVKVGGNLGMDAATNVHIKAGSNLVIEGTSEVTIKCGGSSIVLGPSGVAITGSMVKINSGGSPGSGNGASPVAPTDPEDPEDPLVPEDPLASKHR